MLGMVVHTCNLRAMTAGRALWPVNLTELVSSRFSETVLNNKVKTDRRRHLNIHEHGSSYVLAHIYIQTAHRMGERQEGREGGTKRITEVVWLHLEGDMWLIMWGSFLLVKEDVVRTPVRTPFQSLDTHRCCSQDPNKKHKSLLLIYLGHFTPERGQVPSVLEIVLLCN